MICNLRLSGKKSWFMKCRYRHDIYHDQTNSLYATKRIINDILIRVTELKSISPIIHALRKLLPATKKKRTATQ